MQGKMDLEKLLQEGKHIQIEPQGYSMYPLLVPGRDKAVIAPACAESLKRGDVVLYRRKSGILVLHRIWKRKGRSFYMVGDNQKEIEGPIEEEQMKGILIEVVRNGRRFGTEWFWYRLLSGTWLFCRPFRPAAWKIAAAQRRICSAALTKTEKSMKKHR